MIGMKDLIYEHSILGPPSYAGLGSKKTEECHKHTDKITLFLIWTAFEIYYRVKMRSSSKSFLFFQHQAEVFVFLGRGNSPDFLLLAF